MNDPERDYIVGALETIHHVVKCSESVKEPERTKDALAAILKLKSKVSKM